MVSYLYSCIYLLVHSGEQIVQRLAHSRMSIHCIPQLRIGNPCINSQFEQVDQLLRFCTEQVCSKELSRLCVYNGFQQTVRLPQRCV